MEQILASAVLIVVLLAMLASGVWVAISLMVVGFAGMLLFADAPIGQVLATSVWGSNNSWALAALPLFIWIGEILFRSRLSEDLFSGLAPWLERVPGSLLHVNIVGSGLFAAVSGSSAATCATVGKISIPELRRRKYDDRLIVGTLAGSGTLGLLIPPSIILIVYGVAVEESITRLFLAGVIPGLMILTLFMAYVAIWALVNRKSMPKGEASGLAFYEKIKRSVVLLPFILLIVGVMGSIYTGIASPTDAAAVGVLLSLVLVWRNGDLTWSLFVDSLMGATRTSCMIAFILSGAAFLTITMGYTGIPRALAQWIGEMQLSQYGLIFALMLLFIVLGCFLDGISVVVLTTAVVVPMVQIVGIDLIWFGIFLVLVVEMSQITPPVGFNLFVLQGITGKNIIDIARNALPFFLLLIVGVALITLFPDIVMFLPNQMNR
ncbi:TRAP transporter large permease subunit [uncultured Roseibium sp.]|uniref:TRAP transporter large permease n=1 Tax=uncultured Roseibium sp. TaxID=1936171 RepID=UPI002633639C|nr:TRAP transporter large permease subunit [uncultured Roseibium sp.]